MFIYKLKLKWQINYFSLGFITISILIKLQESLFLFFYFFTSILFITIIKIKFPNSVSRVDAQEEVLAVIIDDAVGNEHVKFDLFLNHLISRVQFSKYLTSREGCHDNSLPQQHYDKRCSKSFEVIHDTEIHSILI